MGGAHGAGRGVTDGEAPRRYGRFRALLHWLLALLVCAMLGFGLLVIAPMPEGDPVKLSIVRTHMILGGAVLLLLLVALPLAWRGRRPAPLSTGSAALDALAALVHHGLRFMLVAMVVTGIATSALSGLPAIAFGGAADHLPEGLRALPSFKAHALLAWGLAGLIALHLAGALFHAVVKRDGIFGRMSIFRP